MAVLSQATFEGQTEGASVTLPTGWTTVGQVPVAAAAAALAGTRGARYASTATSGRMQYDTGANRTTLLIAGFVRVATLSTANLTLLSVMSLTSGGALQGDVRLTPSGTVQIRNGSTAVATSAQTLATGTAYWLEWRLDTATDTQDLRVYTATGTTPIFTLTGAWTSGATRVAAYGPNSAAAGGTNLDYDDLTVADDWIRKAAAPPTLYRIDAGGTLVGYNIELLTGTPAALFAPNYAAAGISDYTDLHHEDHITVTADPAGGTRKVLRFATASTDTGPTENPRTQIGTPQILDIAGGEYWIGFSLHLPAGFVIPPSGQWVTVHEVFGPPYTGQPPIALGVASGSGGSGGTPQLQVKLNGTYNQARPAFIDCPRGQWLDLVLHIRLSTDPAVGFLEIRKRTSAATGWETVTMTPPAGTTWSNGRLYYQTVDAAINGGGANRSQLKNYHLASNWQVPGWPDPSVMYFADHRVGSTFAAAAPRTYDAAA